MPEDPKTDKDRFWLRPGTTEPELRPEFAEEERLAAEASGPTEEKAAKAEKSAATKASKKAAKKR